MNHQASTPPQPHPANPDPQRPPETESATLQVLQARIAELELDLWEQSEDFQQERERYQAEIHDLECQLAAAHAVQAWRSLPLRLRLPVTARRIAAAAWRKVRHRLRLRRHPT
ncbi:hypothetical protein CKO15_02405 [Halorhodospira abdelmalekii]|uniref:hypothetical protein n=1 Tax=Halorhodospira abdelmalekii TaxID=421629 RepID=UPI00190734C4|nr:hypothetical protein [Halorhodospira abdelmalekii]MBK1734151.1 hypothetical protein [Halorhodospira abdelmalekii]